MFELYLVKSGQALMFTKAVMLDLTRGIVCCRQEQPHCTSVSFDRHAANAFQSYVQSAIAFSIKRGAILYGQQGPEGAVLVHAIYEPPQVAFTLHMPHCQCAVTSAGLFCIYTWKAYLHLVHSLAHFPAQSQHKVLLN